MSYSAACQKAYSKTCRRAQSLQLTYSTGMHKLTHGLACTRMRRRTYTHTYIDKLTHQHIHTNIQEDLLMRMAGRPSTHNLCSSPIGMHNQIDTHTHTNTPQEDLLMQLAGGPQVRSLCSPGLVGRLMVQCTRYPR